MDTSVRKVRKAVRIFIIQDEQVLAIKYLTEKKQWIL